MVKAIHFSAKGTLNPSYMKKCTKIIIVKYSAISHEVYLSHAMENSEKKDQPYEMGSTTLISYKVYYQVKK